MAFFALCLVLLWLVQPRANCISFQFAWLGLMPMQVDSRLPSPLHLFAFWPPVVALSLCLPVCLPSIGLPACLPTCLVRLSVRTSVRPSVRLSVRLSVCLSVCLSICSTIHHAKICPTLHHVEACWWCCADGNDGQCLCDELHGHGSQPLTPCSRLAGIFSHAFFHSRHSSHACMRGPMLEALAHKL